VYSASAMKRSKPIQPPLFLAENDSITGITVAVDKGQHLVPLERDIMFVAEQLAPPPPVNP
jgi:hypothetical protein